MLIYQQLPDGNNELTTTRRERGGGGGGGGGGVGGGSLRYKDLYAIVFLSLNRWFQFSAC